MSMVLWTSADDGIDLGDPFDALAAFGELAKAAGGDGGWEELFSVPQFAEEEVEPAWLARVRDQAARFRREHGAGLSGGADALLRRLGGGKDEPEPEDE